jgi:hypothetical protein
MPPQQPHDVARKNRQRFGAARRPRHGFRPRVETLEDRNLMASFYVATTGADTNPGTLDQPFRTIQHAATQAAPGDTVLIRQGIYRETVTPPRSGLAGSPITFQAYNGEAVTVSGADQIPASSWTPNDTHVYRADMPWTLDDSNQVFVDGVMMNEARFPNSPLDPTHPNKLLATGADYSGPLNHIQATLYNPVLNQPEGYWVGATVHANLGLYQWVQTTYTVIASSPGSVTFIMNLDDNQPYVDPDYLDSYLPTQGNPFWLSGRYSELRAAGEWYRDPTTSRLYLWTPDDTDPSTHNVEAKRRISAFDLTDRSYITITGLNIFAATITTSANSNNVTIDHVNASYVSHYTTLTTWLSPGMESSGILLKGANSLIQNSTVAYSAGNGILLMGENSRAINNVVHDIDYEASACAAIFTGAYGIDETPSFTGMEIGNNTVYNTGGMGINFSRAAASRIHHNLVYNLLFQSTDGGGLYTYSEDGQGTRIDHNIVHDLFDTPFGDFYYGWTTGVQIDDNSQNYVVDHNVTWNVTNGFMSNPNFSNIALYNNTFDATDNSIVATESEWDNSTMFIENNILPQHILWDYEDLWQGWTYQVVPAANLVSVVDGGTDPLFTDQTNHDYTLQAASPAVAGGIVIPPYTDGYTGSAPDIGAYPFGQTPWTAGANGGGGGGPYSPLPGGGSGPSNQKWGDPNPAGSGLLGMAGIFNATRFGPDLSRSPASSGSDTVASLSSQRLGTSLFLANQGSQPADSRLQPLPAATDSSSRGDGSDPSSLIGLPWDTQDSGPVRLDGRTV